MKRLYFLWLLICLSTGSASSQALNLLTDSLRQVLLQYPNDERRADSLNTWAFRRRVERPAEALQFAQTALMLSQKTGYLKGQGDSYVRLGILAKNQGEIPGAEDAFLKAAKIRRQIGDKEGEASCYNNLGNLTTQVSRHEDAVRYYHRGLDVLPASPVLELHATLYTNLGTALRFLGRYPEAVLALEQSLKAAQEIGNEDAIAHAELDFANLLLDNLEQQDRARLLLLSSKDRFSRLAYPTGIAKCDINLGILAFFENNYTSALAHYHQALTRRDNLVPADLALVYTNMAEVFAQQKRYQEALANYRFGLDIVRELGNKWELTKLLLAIGNVYKDQADYQRAIAYYQQALTEIEQLDDPALKSQTLLYLSDSYDLLGNHEEAFAFQERYLSLQDDLYQTKQDATKLQLQLTEERNKSTATALALTQQEASSQRFQKRLLMVGLWLLAGIAALVVYLLRQKRKLAEKEAQLALQRVDEVLRDRELEATYAWLDGQEEARRKIGQDLHDSLGGLLAMVKLYFTQVNSRLDNLEEENRGQYEKATRLLDDASSEVRRISHEMTSLTLTKFGLKAQIESLADTLRSTNTISVELSTHGLQDRLPSALEVKIYRIVQELVTNVLRHAKATKLTIQLNRFEDIVNIMIEDNGVGFDPEAVKARPDSGLGLRNIEARIHDLEGLLVWDAQPGRGTTVSIDIPLLVKTPTTTAVPA